MSEPNTRIPSAIELALSCFHHKDKNCKVNSFGLPLPEIIEEPNYWSDWLDEFLEMKGQPPSYIKCRTHNVVACKCGAEFGHHHYFHAPQSD